MNISNEEAQTSLDMISQTQTRLRKAIASGYASHLLILWGVIWVIGYISLHFSYCIGGYVFTGLDVVGVLATVWIARRWPHHTFIRSPEFKTIAWQSTGLWFFLLLYALIWCFLLRPDNSREFGVFLCTVCMFGYVMIGLWRRGPFMIWLGLGVTALTLFGYCFLSDFFYLWMAAAGGGALLGTGWYIRRWR